jgi:hypothetical protein
MVPVRDSLQLSDWNKLAASGASTYGLVVERPNEGVAIAIFGGGYWSLGLYHRVDTAN